MTLLHQQTTKEIRETTPSPIPSNNITYLGVTLTKQVKDLYENNFKSLKKEIEVNIRRCKDLQYLWIGRIIEVKMAILPESICRFNTIFIKIPTQTESHEDTYGPCCCQVPNLNQWLILPP